MKITIPSHLSDDELLAEVRSLAGRERQATAYLIAHLAELDARRLHLGAGFSSLFMYCVEVLRRSEAEAYNRIEAARAARRFPLILERLAEGSEPHDGARPRPAPDGRQPRGTPCRGSRQDQA